MKYLLLMLLAISGIKTVPLFSALEDKVESYIENLPGEEAQEAKFLLEKELFQQLLDKKVVRKKGSDAEMRPLFVGLQARIEGMITEMLAKGTCEKAIGVILTPAPPTPLCTKGEISKELVHPSMLQEEKSLQTVRERPSILRSYLEVGGVLYAAFPQEGSNLRTLEQQAIFKTLTAAYPDRLIPSILKTKSVDEDKIGAIYFFKEAGTEEWMVFAIHSTQAISPKDTTHWGVWLGSVKNPEILKKALEVMAYFKKLSNSKDFPAEIATVLEGAQ